MADEELDEIRARRMAQLQQQMGQHQQQFGNFSPEIQMGGGGGQANPEEQAAKQQQMREMKNSILSQVLSQEARARLNTIALTKPDKAQMVENMLCQMAQSGQIQSKLGEDQLKGLLEKVSSQTRTTTVKFDRRRAALDSDSD